MENRAGLGWRRVRGQGARELPVLGRGTQGARGGLGPVLQGAWVGKPLWRAPAGENEALGTIAVVRGTTRVGERGLQNQFEIVCVKGKINKTTQEMNF